MPNKCVSVGSSNLYFILLNYAESTKDCLGIILDLTLESVVADEDTLEAANGRGAIL